MKFSGKVGNGPTNKWLNFGGDPDRITVWIRRLFSGFATIGRYRKWLTVILIRQMAALVRRALAEECTVPVVLVHFVWAFKTFNAARLMRNNRKCIVTLRMASFAREGGIVDVSLIFNYFSTFGENGKMDVNIVFSTFHFQWKQNKTRHRASTSMYSLTFRVRIMLPQQRSPCTYCKSAK